MMIGGPRCGGRDARAAWRGRSRRGLRLARFMKQHPDAGLITAQTFQDLLTIARKR